MDVVYVIPPYLLHTCLGEELERELALVDSTLYKYNFFPATSSKYKFRSSADVCSTPFMISEDPHLNSVIMRKLKERFASLGVLGNTPAAPCADKYIYDLYMTFRRWFDPASAVRLAESDSNASENEENGDRSNATDHLRRKVKSIYQEKNLGEFLFGWDYSGPKLLDLGSWPLEKLLERASHQRENEFDFYPYLMIDTHKAFLLPLPMYWTSMSVDDRQKTLEKDLNMTIGLRNGYSEINFRLQNTGVKWARELLDRRYFNFIADREVKERTGIYYYEVTVEQKATKDSHHTPIVQTNDESVSSGMCILFSAGYTKRFTRFSTPDTSSSSIFSPYIDLQETQKKIQNYNRGVLDSAVGSDVIDFLNGEPGVSFDGSAAVSFNNSCSFSPVKHQLDTALRTAPFGRRFLHGGHNFSAEQEISDLGLDVPFSTTCRVRPNTDKVYTSDVVGFGVNFVTLSLFVTVNGILVKVIEKENMELGNPYKDTLFSHGSHPGSLYPIIGFQLSNIGSLRLGTELSETCIQTNFGQRAFRFNIDNHVQSFKAAQAAQFQRAITESLVPDDEELDLICPFEKSIRDNKEEQLFLQHLIHEYLSNKGYEHALSAFRCDLLDLSQHVSKNDSSNYFKHLKASVKSPRHKIRKLIIEECYLQARDLLLQQYPDIPGLTECLFELRLLAFLKQVQHYLDNILGDLQNNALNGNSNGAKLALFRDFQELGEDASATSHIRKVLNNLLENVFAHKSNPTSLRILDTRKQDAEKLADHLNELILQQEGTDSVSKLEKVVKGTRKNVSELSGLSGEQEAFFKLVNFDREYLG